MSRELERAKARYAESRNKSFLQSAKILVPVLETDFTITSWGAKAREAYKDQWKTSHFDWDEIFRRHRDPDRLDMVIWTKEERLSALALCTTSGQAVNMLFLEGDSRPGCPLKGRRTLIALETAGNYAQDRGKKELRLYPLNGQLEELFTEVYGFTLEKDAQGVSYWRKGI